MVKWVLVKKNIKFEVEIIFPYLLVYFQSYVWRVLISGKPNHLSAQLVVRVGELGSFGDTREV